MVKRSRVYSSSSSSNSGRSGGGGVGGSGGSGGGGGGGGGSGGNRWNVLVTVGLLVLYNILLCGGAVSGTTSPGNRSLNAVAVAAERPAGGRYAAGDDGAAAGRNGRSAANLSHITGTARKIKMFIKNRYLQVFSDGTVNGTAEDTSDYVILQRTSVNMGQLKIQGVATCMYLCMDACGLLYGSKDFDEECVFNEMIEQNHYNTYSSAKYTNDKRTLYLALNKRGLPRKVHVKANAPLGKLSAYTRVLTQNVQAQRVEQLLATRRPVPGAEWPAFAPHGHRHHHACPPHVGPPLQPSNTAIKHRKAGRKCQARGRKKNREETVGKDGGGGGGAGGGGGSGEDEDCSGGSGNRKNLHRCGGGGDENSHRKSDAAGRKKKSKKPTAAGKGDKPPSRQQQQPSGGKGRKSEPLDAPLPSPSRPSPEPAVVIQTVTTVVVPSQLLDDDDDDDSAPAATVQSDVEFLDVNDNLDVPGNN